MNLVNGKPSSSISIFDRGFLYGDSIFETILVIDKIPHNLKSHVNRLKKGCKVLKIINFDLNTLYKQIDKALADEKNCILNVNITRGTALSRGYNISNVKKKPNIIITTSKVPKYPKEYTDNGIKTKFSKKNLSENENLSKIKHSNRLEQVLATSELSKNFPELILCDAQNNIIEGISSNIFFIKDKKFYTPIIDRTGVEGVMKDFLITLLKKNKYEVIKKNISKMDISNYDAAFFCNSVRLIWNIKSISEIKYKKNNLIKELIRIVNNELS